MHIEIARGKITPENICPEASHLLTSYNLLPLLWQPYLVQNCVSPEPIFKIQVLLIKAYYFKWRSRHAIQHVSTRMQTAHAQSIKRFCNISLEPMNTFCWELFCSQMTEKGYSCVGIVILFRKVAMEKGWENISISRGNLKPQSILWCSTWSPSPQLFNEVLNRGFLIAVNNAYCQIHWFFSSKYRNVTKPEEL